MGAAYGTHQSLNMISLLAVHIYINVFFSVSFSVWIGIVRGIVPIFKSSYRSTADTWNSSRMQSTGLSDES